MPLNQLPAGLRGGGTAQPGGERDDAQPGGERDEARPGGERGEAQQGAAPRSLMLGHTSSQQRSVWGAGMPVLQGQLT